MPILFIIGKTYLHLLRIHFNNYCVFDYMIDSNSIIYVSRQSKTNTEQNDKEHETGKFFFFIVSLGIQFLFAIHHAKNKYLTNWHFFKIIKKIIITLQKPFH